MFLGTCSQIVRMPSDPILRKSAILNISFVSLLWCIKLCDWLLDWPLVTVGVYPLSPQSLVGVLLGPLLHGSFAHIATNTFAVLILGTALLCGYPKTRWWVIGNDMGAIRYWGLAVWSPQLPCRRERSDTWLVLFPVSSQHSSEGETFDRPDDDCFLAVWQHVLGSVAKRIRCDV